MKPLEVFDVIATFRKIMIKERLYTYFRELILNSPLRNVYQYHRVRLIASPAIYFVNFVFQRILGVNRKVRWSVHYTSTIQHPERIKIGRNVDRSFAVSGGCYFQGWNGINIGDDTIFAPGVKIMSANHNFSDLGQLNPSNPVVIGSNCWLGANVLIMPGVRLGDNVVVGAGAVVTHEFPDRVILAGMPARIIGEHRSYEA